MKKLLLAIAVAGFFAACNNKKEDEKKVDDTSTTTATDQTDKATEPATNEPSGNTSITGVPTFSDPEVQQFANDYAAFISEYKKVLANPASTQSAEFAMKWSQWASRSMSVGMKIASNPAESQKWSQWVESVNNEIRAMTK
ncbi:MAG TPA: hypothetical protein PKC72_05475 [Chitinophagaceae bacterium]|nr:hypothetical protein [Chitinophagaceae bacterium]